jgi:hypothetical protein
MNKKSGLAMASLTVYVITMVVVISIIATITSFFYTNVNTLNDNSDNISEITKFHMYFLEETTKKDNNVIEIDEKKSITFASGNTFTFQDNSIYFNHIKICEEIYDISFSKETKDSKEIVNVYVKIGQGSGYKKTTQYVLNQNL